jgi:hypothetical protein
MRALVYHGCHHRQPACECGSPRQVERERSDMRVCKSTFTGFAMMSRWNTFGVQGL